MLYAAPIGRAALHRAWPALCINLLSITELCKCCERISCTAENWNDPNYPQYIFLIDYIRMRAWSWPAVANAIGKKAVGIWSLAVGRNAETSTWPLRNDWVLRKEAVGDGGRTGCFSTSLRGDERRGRDPAGGGVFNSAEWPTDRLDSAG